ncbi:MAG TPA: helix-turn-helix transcriptional regulator [Caulobacteraceae bacterium]|nr:helix-turn-helix transcriptional regulator [Caulobacteraceae bacterium]
MPRRDQEGLLDIIYGAAADPALWPSAMEALADGLGGTTNFLSKLSIVDGGGEALTTRIDPASRGPYLAHYGAINVLNNVPDRTAYRAAWKPLIHTDDQWMPKEEFLASEYYNDFLRPLEVHSVMMLRLGLTGDTISAMSIGRPEAWGPFEPSHLEAAQRVYPHLLRAFRLGQKLEPTLALAGELAAVLDQSAHGVFVVDGAGRVRHVNRAGEALLRRGVGLRVAACRLTATQPECGRQLEALIGAATTCEPGSSKGGTMALPFEVGRLPLSITVTPFQPPPAWPLAQAHTALVCVTDLEAGGRPPRERLRQLFGLTAAEARVALALFDGSTLKEAAEALSISAHTAHIHLSRVFEKTGTHRQSQLVALMMRTAGLRFEEQP